MISITAKFLVKPEFADTFPDLTREFTDGVRAEEGNLWFEWSRSVENQNEYVLIEAFRDSAAGEKHVKSAHFEKATSEIPRFLQETPRIVSNEVPGEGWERMGEMQVS